MARKTIKKPAPAASRTQFQAHDLILAGFGAVSLGRKQVIEAYANGFEGVTELRSKAERAFKSASKTINGKVDDLRAQAEAKAAPVKKSVIRLADEARAQAQTRLAPVLAKLGIKPAPKKRAPAKKRPATRSRRAA